MLKRIIVAGGRDFMDVDRVYDTLRRVQNHHPILRVICGMAQGADMLGKAAAERLGIPVDEYPADWKKYGRRAGPVRNLEMAEDADVLIAFWDGESRGTRSMINIALDEGLTVHVYRYADPM